MTAKKPLDLYVHEGASGLCIQPCKTHRNWFWCLVSLCHHAARHLHSPTSPQAAQGFVLSKKAQTKTHSHLCSCVQQQTSTWGLLTGQVEAGKTPVLPKASQPRDSVALSRCWPRQCYTGGKHPRLGGFTAPLKRPEVITH